MPRLVGRAPLLYALTVHLLEELDQKRSPIGATPPKLADRSTKFHRVPDAVLKGQTADL